MDRGEELLRLFLRSRLVAGSHRPRDAVLHVPVEDLEREAVERGRDGPDLREDVDAVAVVVDHLLDPADLPLDPVEALRERLLLSVVAVVGVLGRGVGHWKAPWRWLRKRRSRRLLLTTKRLEAAIAAAAIIGFSRPATASGIAATL